MERGKLLIQQKAVRISIEWAQRITFDAERKSRAPNLTQKSSYTYLQFPTHEIKSYQTKWLDKRY